MKNQTHFKNHYKLKKYLPTNFLKNVINFCCCYFSNWFEMCYLEETQNTFINKWWFYKPWEPISNQVSTCRSKIEFCWDTNLRPMGHIAHLTNSSLYHFLLGFKYFPNIFQIKTLNLSWIPSISLGSQFKRSTIYKNAFIYTNCSIAALENKIFKHFFKPYFYVKLWTILGARGISLVFTISTWNLHYLRMIAQ